MPRNINNLNYIIMKKTNEKSPMDRILEAIFGKNGERYEEVMRRYKEKYPAE